MSECFIPRGLSRATRSDLFRAESRKRSRGKPREARNPDGVGVQLFCQFVIFGIAILFFATLNYSQVNHPAVVVKASLSKDKITLGDVTTYTVEVFSYPEVKLGPIPFGSNLSGFEIKKDTILPVSRLKGREVRRAIFDITVFTVGTFTIPPLAVTCRNQRGDSGETVFSPALKLVVASLLEPDSTKHGLKAEKPPFEVGVSLWPWIGLVLWGLSALAFVLWVLKHQSAKIAEKEKPDLRPPWEVAFAELEELLLSQHLRQGNLKRFHIRLSEIFRWYAHRMYRIPAQDLTSEEQLEQLRQFLRDEPWLEATRFLTFCDLVKFARWEPEEKQISENVECLKKIIEATRLKPIPKLAAEPEVVEA